MSDLLVVFILFGLPVLGLVLLGLAWMRHGREKARLELAQVQARVELAQAEARRAEAELRLLEAEARTLELRGLRALPR
ncbi:MAG: hypothetical protein VX899_07610 [Myxococcota bacterium]|nr:hypothetical protein [Myxococcota bacterium]